MHIVSSNISIIRTARQLSMLHGNICTVIARRKTIGTKPLGKHILNRNKKPSKSH